jgi:hypothetical protein
LAVYVSASAADKMIAPHPSENSFERENLYFWNDANMAQIGRRGNPETH